MKSLLIATLVTLAVVSTVSGGKSKQRGRKFHQRGREFEQAQGDPDIIASANENIAQIEEALALIQQTQKELYGDVESMDHSAAQQASEDLQSQISDALDIAQANPQAQALQEEIVAEKIVDTHDELDKYLKQAKRHQEALEDYGPEMTPEEATEHHKGLQKYLELALHYAQQHMIAVAEDNAIQEGSDPADIAPAVMAQGRSLRGRSFGK